MRRLPQLGCVPWGIKTADKFARPERQYRLHGDARFFTLVHPLPRPSRRLGALPRAIIRRVREFLPCFYSPFARAISCILCRTHSSNAHLRSIALPSLTDGNGDWNRARP